MDNLLLAEQEWQVLDLIGRGMKGRWVALGPGAMWALDKMGVEYHIPEDFYDEEELERTCLEVHEKLEKYCKAIDGLILEQYPGIKSRGMSPFMFNIFQLTVIFDSMVSRIFQLRAVLRAYSGYRIHVHSGPSYPTGDGVLNLAFSRKETLWGKLLSMEEIRRSFPNPINIIPASDISRNNDKKGRYSARLKSLASKSFVANHVAHRLRSGDIRGALDIAGGKKSLIVHNGMYEWAYILDSLRKDGWRIIFTNDCYFNRKLLNNSGNGPGHAQAMVSEIRSLVNNFSFCGVDLFSLVEKRIQWVLGAVPCGINKVVQEIHKIIDKYSVGGIINSVSPTYVSHVVAQSGRHLGVPVIKWQHGLVNYNGRISQYAQYNDLMTSDLVLAFGEDIERAYKHYSEQFGPRILSVGSASLDLIRTKNGTPRNNSSESKKILYVTTNYYENDWYLAFSAAFNDRSLYKDQLTIMKTLKALGTSNEITVKLCPHKYQDPPWVESFRGNNNIKCIKDETPLTDLLLSNDIIIIDFPSTTLLQAISTKKPVFVLTRYIPFPERILEMLKRRAVCSHDVEHLMLSLMAYVQSSFFPADVSNNEFLISYGNYSDDGRSSARALKVINDFIPNHRSNFHSSGRYCHGQE